jgi:hypothetical protein
MNHLANSNGIYYFDVAIPNTLGVYIVDAYCYYSDVQYSFYPYKVSYDGSLYQESEGTPLEVRDDDCIMLKTTDGMYQEVLFNDSAIGNINISTITEINIAWSGQNNKYGRLNVYNWVNSSWDTKTVLGRYSVGGCELTKYNLIKLTMNLSNYVSGNLVKARIYTTETGTGNIYSDRFSLIFHNNGSVVSSIRGGGELHVSNSSQQIFAEISAHNTSVFGKLYKIQDEITSVNNTVKNESSALYNYFSAVNSSLFSEFGYIELQIGNITFNTTGLEELVASVNNTVMAKLYAVQGDIAALDTGIGSVNDTIKSANATIMWKLYSIQDELATINMTVGNLTINVTIPTEMNLTNQSLESLGDEVIIKMLQNARILNQRVVNFHNSQYCIDNNTLQHNVTYEYCAGEGNCRMMIDIMNENCVYGCDYERKQCLEPPYLRNIYIFGGVLAVFVTILIVLRLAGKI